MVKNKGFTLVELLAVIVIIGATSILIVPKLIERFEVKKEDLNKQAKELLYLAASQYMDLKQDDNISCISLKELIDNGFLVEPVIDPKTNTVVPDTSNVKVSKNNNQYDYEFSNTCFYNVIFNLKNVKVDRKDVVMESSSVEEVNVTPNAYYLLPDDISVSGSNYTWNKDTGKVILKNAYSDVTVEINGVSTDSENPTIVVNPDSGTFDTSTSVTITVSDNMELDSNNVYQYYLSTSSTNRENGSWITYESGKPFTITGNNETKYLWIWPVKDALGNISDGKSNVNTPYVAGIYKFSSEYVINYDCNGGSGSTASSTHKSNVSKKLSTNGCYKIVAGTNGTVYHVAGWSRDSSATNPEYSDEEMVTNVTSESSITLYAVWDNLFTYTGTYNVVDEGSGNWLVNFLDSGTYTSNYSTSIDAFLVGGGGAGSSTGAGGGGGYYKTVNNIQTKNSTITIGDGGSTSGGSGGSTSAFDNSVNGGSGGEAGTPYSQNVTVYGTNGTASNVYFYPRNGASGVSQGNGYVNVVLAYPTTSVTLTVSGQSVYTLKAYPSGFYKCTIKSVNKINYTRGSTGAGGTETTVLHTNVRVSGAGAETGAIDATLNGGGGGGSGSASESTFGKGKSGLVTIRNSR